MSIYAQKGLRILIYTYAYGHYLEESISVIRKYMCCWCAGHIEKHLYSRAIVDVIIVINKGIILIGLNKLCYIVLVKRFTVALPCTDGRSSLEVDI